MKKAINKIVGLIISFTLLISVFIVSGCNIVSLEDYKEIKIQALQDYADAKGEENYSIKNWEKVCDAVIIGKIAIDEAMAKSQVDTVLKNAKGNIDAVERKDETNTINFTLILGRMDYGVSTDIEAIVYSFTEWSGLGAVIDLPDFSNKFNEQYFENKVLIIFALGRATRGAQFVKVEITSQNNELFVKVFDDGNGHMDVESNWIVVIEIQKNLIDEFTNLRLETNFYSFSL